MDVQEAYILLREDLTAPTTLTAEKMEEYAAQTLKAAPWIWTAAAYAIKGQKEEFARALKKAAENDSYPHPEALQALAQNPDSAYEQLHNLAPKTTLEQATKWLCAKELSLIPSFNNIEEKMAKIESQASITQHSPNSIKITLDMYLFHAYDLETPTGKQDFEERVKILESSSSFSRLVPVIFRKGTDRQTGHIGWYLAGF